MSDEQMEQEILDKGLTKGPRISLEHVQGMLERVEYFVEQPAGTTVTLAHAFLDGKFFLATGFNACVDPDNFDAEFGKKYALQAAENLASNKLYELEGYRLYHEIRLQDQDL